MIKLNIKGDTYGSSYEGSSLWKYTDGKSKEYISNHSYLSIDIFVGGTGMPDLNSYKEDSAKILTKKEYTKQRKALLKAAGVVLYCRKYKK